MDKGYLIFLITQNLKVYRRTMDQSVKKTETNYFQKFFFTACHYINLIGMAGENKFVFKSHNR